MSVASQVVNITGALSCPVDYRGVLQKSDSECRQNVKANLTRIFTPLGFMICSGGCFNVQSEHNN